MKTTTTQRGFDLIEFTDGNGQKCSLQKSSAAEQDYIWLGCDDINLKVFIPYNPGWLDVSDDTIKSIYKADSVLANTRMHLTREQVKDLLPILTKFVKTGELT